LIAIVAFLCFSFQSLEQVITKERWRLKYQPYDVAKAKFNLKETISAAKMLNALKMKIFVRFDESLVE
jgi:hypothetical protein